MFEFFLLNNNIKKKCQIKVATRRVEWMEMHTFLVEKSKLGFDKMRGCVSKWVGISWQSALTGHPPPTCLSSLSLSFIIYYLFIYLNILVKFC